MMPTTAALATLAAQLDGLLPINVAGWVALVASVSSVIMIPVAYGKWLEKVNGQGVRVTKVEAEQEKQKGVDQERRRDLDRILANHDDLIRQIGESKRGADQCREDAEKHAITIGSKVADATRSLDALALALSQRLTAVETELRMTRPRGGGGGGGATA